MISSTIGELARERLDISHRLEAAAIADGWLFEIHATAAGAPAEARYLEIARTCDVYVVIVADQGSPATEAEYRSAFEDNPRKILPFFVGPGTSQTKSFRELIESRHIRVRRDALSDLAPAVVDAVLSHLAGGELVRPLLLENVDLRLERAEQLVTTDLPVAFIPFVRRDTDTAGSSRPDSVPATVAADDDKRIVLIGIGGSGKTYSALVVLRRAVTSGALPLIVEPAPGQHDLEDLLLAAFERASFFPGRDLLHQLARDGRLAVLVDGIDALTSPQRRSFLDAVNDFAERFPRSLIVCCVRQILPTELSAFVSWAVEPLTDRQTAEMFQAVNAPQVKSFPAQVADLARWPMWAWALFVVGAEVPTGLVLLGELVEHRIRRSGAFAPIEVEFLVTAASAVAFEAWPRSTVSADVALSALAEWGTSEIVRTRFAVSPAEDVLRRLSEAGIVQIGQDVVFAHPLFATYLSASHAAGGVPMTDDMASDPEFAMFVAALLDEERASEALALLSRHGPVGQARFLRLVPQAPRVPSVSDEVSFGEAVKVLDGVAAACIRTAEWTAWRPENEPRVALPDELPLWMAEGEVTVVQGDIFHTRSPLDVAAIEALARFKSHVNRHVPPGPAFERASDRELKRLRGRARSEVAEIVLQAVLDWRAEWRRQAQALRIDGLPEAAVGDGDPAITLYDTWPDPLVDITWNSTASVSWVEGPPSDMWKYQPLSAYLDPGRAARIYDDLVRRTERALGCSFSSRTWNRPELVASWAW